VKTILKHLTVLSASVLGCAGPEPAGTGGPPPPPPNDAALHAGVIISAPILPGAGVPGIVSEASVFVSMLPGTIPEGVTATITNVGRNIAVTTPVLSGGFDPVVIPAAEGDSIRIRIDLANGAVRETFEHVQPNAPVRVIRTTPAAGEIGVPVNAGAIAVLSEPVDPGSVSRSSVGLGAGGYLAGTPYLTGDVANQVEFDPEQPLSVLTDYTLTLASGVRGVSGGRLGTSVSFLFTTGPTAEPREPTSIRIEPAVTALSLWERSGLRLHFFDAAGHSLIGNSASWTSQTPDVAIVDGGGIVTALAPGRAEIVATSQGLSASGAILVNPGATPSGHGAVLLEATEAGPDADLDGYVAVLLDDQDIGFRTPVFVASSGLALMQDLDAGTGRLWVTDVDPNCAVSDDLRPISVVANSTIRSQVVITCEPRSRCLATIR
jgi:hypothetical protein